MVLIFDCLTAERRRLEEYVSAKKKLQQIYISKWEMESIKQHEKRIDEIIAATKEIIEEICNA